MSPIRMKVCCISSPQEADMAVRAGASALGLVSAMPSGPGVISEERIDQIARGVPPGVSTFLLTSKTEAADIVAQQRRCGADTLQLCDRTSPKLRAELRRRLPGIRLVQVVHVTGPETLAEAAEAAEHAHALLLDSGRPDNSKRELGGTGRTHDWELSQRVVHQASLPVFLAGGLNPDNVSRAVRGVSPFGVDVCSGLRTGGQLDGAKLARFASAIAAATVPADEDG